MNIFVLDFNPRTAAMFHCDKHVVKMVLETAQIISTVTGEGYRPTHLNHPCTKWARESAANFSWLRHLGVYLGNEYTRRYFKRHKSSYVIENSRAPDSLPKTGMTPFALAMPDEYKQECPVASYRAYYLGEKNHMLKYTNCEVPNWVVSARRAC